MLVCKLLQASVAANHLHVNLTVLYGVLGIGNEDGRISVRPIAYGDRRKGTPPDVNGVCADAGSSIRVNEGNPTPFVREVVRRLARRKSIGEVGQRSYYRHTCPPRSGVGGEEERT